MSPAPSPLTPLPLPHPPPPDPPPAEDKKDKEELVTRDFALQLPWALLLVHSHDACCTLFSLLSSFFFLSLSLSLWLSLSLSDSPSLSLTPFLSFFSARLLQASGIKTRSTHLEQDGRTQHSWIRSVLVSRRNQNHRIVPDCVTYRATLAIWLIPEQLNQDV